MTAIGFEILILIFVLVKILPQVAVGLIEEVGLANGYPIQLGIAGKELLHLGLESGVFLHLIVERLALLHIHAAANAQPCGEKTVVIELRGIQTTNAKGMASTHRQSANGASGTALDGFIVAVYIAHNVVKALFHAGYGLVLRPRVAHEGRSVHAERPLAGRCLAVRIAVRHDYYHRLSFARSDKIVENLRGTTQLRPRVFVATGAMEQVERGVSLALIVARAGVNVQSTVHFERGTGVPHLGQITMGSLVNAIKIALVAFLFADDKYVAEGRDVTVAIDV